MRDEIIADINNAYYAGAYLSALTLALAIPDYCGTYYVHKVYDKIIKRQKITKIKESGYHYQCWYNRYVLNREEEESLKIYIKEEEKFKISSRECYALRCSVIHNMNTRIEEQSVLTRNNSNNVTLCISDSDSSIRCIDPITGERIIRESGRIFIDMLTEGYRKFLAEYKDFHLIFNNYIDVKK